MNNGAPVPSGELVSIIVPNLNRADLLAETLASVQAQTWTHFEVLIVDDGSSDASIQIAEDFAQRDGRFALLRRETYAASSGAQVCRNLGWNASRGGYLVFLDSDDLLSPTCIAERLEALRSDWQLDFVVGQCRLFQLTPDDADSLWCDWGPGQDDLDSFVTGRIPWQTSGPLWRRTALEKVGRWDEALVHVGHDNEFHVRALCRGLRYAKNPVVDYFWRKPRSDSLSSHEVFRRRHADGGMLRAFAAIVHDLAAADAITPLRRAALVEEALRLAVFCRLGGGRARTALTGVDLAAREGWVPATAAFEIRLAIRLWLHVAGRNPSMAWLNRRFPGVLGG